MAHESALDHFPEHVRAVGAISIENANLELALADLLSALLKISRRAAHAIYFTPRAAALRLEILQAVANARFAQISKRSAEHRNTLAKVQRIVKRCFEHIQKRHNVIHDAWIVGPMYRGEEITGMFIARHKMRDAIDFKTLEEVSLENLENIIQDFRRLIVDVRSLTTDMRS